MSISLCMSACHLVLDATGGVSSGCSSGCSLVVGSALVLCLFDGEGGVSCWVRSFVSLEGRGRSLSDSEGESRSGDALPIGSLAH